MKANPTQEIRLSCPGTDESIPPTLKTEYPHDKATGYTLGKIRGAITIKCPL